MIETFKTQLSKTGESGFYVNRVIINSETGFMPVSVINELRRNILEKLMDERFKNYYPAVQKGLQYAQFPLKSYDYHANVYNNTAKVFYENCGCNITEFAPEMTRDFKGKELMRCKHCLKFAFDMCKSPEKLYLIDEKGKKYNLNFDCKKCEMTITE